MNVINLPVGTENAPADMAIELRRYAPRDIRSGLTVAKDTLEGKRLALFCYCSVYCVCMDTFHESWRRLKTGEISVDGLRAEIQQDEENLLGH